MNNGFIVIVCIHAKFKNKCTAFVVSMWFIFVSPSSNPIADYWFRISPSMSMIVIGHSLLY
jgi:hypothetical protein